MFLIRTISLHNKIELQNPYIFLHHSAFFAVISIRNSFSTANDAPSLEGTVVAFVAYMN